LERAGGLAVLTLDNPPLNQISEQVVDDLAESIAVAQSSHSSPRGQATPRSPAADRVARWYFRGSSGPV